MINGRVRTLIYTYYNYVNAKGEIKEIPAYCVNPNTTGVPQTVDVGESIEYLAEEKTSDPKVLGIVANGYPTRSLEELGLENKYQGYYATKMALWCYLLSNWDINNLKDQFGAQWRGTAARTEDARCRQRTSMPAAQHGMKSCPLK